MPVVATMTVAAVVVRSLIAASATAAVGSEGRSSAAVTVSTTGGEPVGGGAAVVEQPLANSTAAKAVTMAETVGEGMSGDGKGLGFDVWPVARRVQQYPRNRIITDFSAAVTVSRYLFFTCTCRLTYVHWKDGFGGNH